MTDPRAHTDHRSVAMIVGSVSEPSLNARFGDALARLAPRAGLTITTVPIDGLPFFGAHLQKAEDYPDVGRELKDAVDGADGLLVVTPEYNRSIPGVLKNAVDWLSRPVGESSFPGKPTAVIGTSKGVISTAVAQAHLKSILASQGANLVGSPEAYIRYSEGLVDDEGNVTDADTEGFLLTFLRAHRALIDALDEG
ncbi:NAD(P)H-dependent oxidoreductase [Microbacterium sp. LRZ72]|uniref:NADPH-dependent FMN reductase n=1 Tax=Microbacterium sp. LRZ72 TaxID=2942481 RepID=UPI0029A5AD1B|nr:NADPH-dependent FMN reductase [Microbacterium sp. LRZ72]MDX2377229.1 NAD(P)H-dependent oxidoreductase [Microbacterium sp. LRZ72]